MQIEEQIKSLLRIKAKIDLYKKLVENLNYESSSANQDGETEKFVQENPGLLPEFVDEVVAFASSRIQSLSAGHSPPTRTVVAPAEPVVAPEPQKQPPPMEEPKDPLKFLLKYRHWDNKRVSFESKDGKVSGVVRGMVTPFIRVETDNGYVLNVEPKLIALED